MTNTAKALIAGLALIMVAACAEEEGTAEQQQQTKVDKHAKHAKKHGHHKMDPVAHAEKFAAFAGLDEAQKAKAIAIFKDTSTGWDVRKPKLMALLTPEQRAKLDKHHKAVMKKKHGKYGKDMAKHHAEKLQEKLGITDAQKAKVEAALVGHKWDEIKKILTEDQYDELIRLKKEHHKGHWKKRHP